MIHLEAHYHHQHMDDHHDHDHQRLDERLEYQHLGERFERLHLNQQHEGQNQQENLKYQHLYDQPQKLAFTMSGAASIRLSSTTSEETTVSLTSPTTPPCSSPTQTLDQSPLSPSQRVKPLIRRCHSSGKRHVPIPHMSPMNSPTSPRTGSPHSPRPVSPRSPASPKSPRSPRSPRGSRPCSPCPNSPCSTYGCGNLAYLASRRTSRESEAGEVAPLVDHKSRRPSNFLELPVPDHYRPRVGSLPEHYNPRACEQIYRLRTFSITSKGVINRGDSIISRRSRSNTSVCSTASRPSSRSCRSGERSPFEGSCCGSSYVSSDTSAEVSKFRVVLLGESGVGKTALVSQFMTSEYMNTYDASLDDEFGEKSVSVSLDGEENEVIFVDHPAHEMSVENCLTTYDPHACVVVYSVTDRSSFKKAEDILNYLWQESSVHKTAVILVGNKVDLVRSRTVTLQEGKGAASRYEAKFIETSSGIQHNVDELLVGVVKQVRLRLAANKKQLKKLSTSRTSLSLQAAKDILHKMCVIDLKSKSCENLHKL